MTDRDYPATKAELIECVEGFESTHDRKPVIAASDEFLLVIDEWNRYRPKKLPPGTNLVEDRRKRYDGTKLVGCEIRAGADNFNLE